MQGSHSKTIGYSGGSTAGLGNSGSRANFNQGGATIGSQSISFLNNQDSAGENTMELKRKISMLEKQNQMLREQADASNKAVQK